MLPDLGKYEVAVLSAYAASIVLIAVLVAWTLIRGAKVRRQLAEVEKRRGRGNG